MAPNRNDVENRQRRDEGGPLHGRRGERNPLRITEEDVVRVQERADEIVQKFEAGGVFDRLRSDGELLVAMIRDLRSRAYTRFPWWGVTALVFGLLYVLNPFDLMPDVLPIIGQLDDLGVLAAMLAMIEHNLHQYRDWRAVHGDGTREQRYDRV